MAPCSHSSLSYEVSPHASEAGFDRPSHPKRIAATTPAGRVPELSASSPEASFMTDFPAPLVLPDDDLALDPTCPPQSFRSWMMYKERNKVTKTRNVIYIVDAPEITFEVSFMTSWAIPTILGSSSSTSRPGQPTVNDVASYLGAFFHGLPVKQYAPPFRFVPWDANPGPKSKYVGLSTSPDNCVRITTRSSPDKGCPRQLSLNDLLDAVIEVLPPDAYAMLLLCHHDLYEDEDDDFCCGRAYGGSRVAVVSSLRYHPVLDAPGGVDRAHMWPVSHCAAYVDKLVGATKSTKTRRSKKGGSNNNHEVGALQAAVLAAAKTPTPQSTDDLYGLWLSRFVRTASHELGHCFALDHCVYYACVMQGTSGIIEDNRQPPYLCPVCLSKMAHCVTTENPGWDKTAPKEQWVRDRYKALGEVSAQWSNVGMFVGLGAWAEERIRRV